MIALVAFILARGRSPFDAGLLKLCANGGIVVIFWLDD
jgi:hypothetical protein